MNLLQILSDARRWKNPATYLSILATLPAIFALFHVSFLDTQWSTVETIVKAVLSLLVELGVLMNPTNPGFSDKEV